MKKGIIVTGLIGTGGLLINKFVVQPYLTKKREQEAEELREWCEKRADEVVKPFKEGLERMDITNKEMEENLEYHKTKLYEFKKRNEF